MTGMEMNASDSIVPIDMERLQQKRRQLIEIGGAPLAGR